MYMYVVTQIKSKYGKILTIVEFNGGHMVVLVNCSFNVSEYLNFFTINLGENPSSRDSYKDRSKILWSILDGRGFRCVARASQRHDSCQESIY